MTNTAAKMAADEFERVASTCSWGARSLDVVRALLVDGTAPSIVAEQFDVTTQHAGVLRRRFEAKALTMSKKKITAEDFMQIVKPEGDAALEPFRRELQTLRTNGYSNEQLRLYLLENGIDTTESKLEQFLTKATSHANPRSSK